MGVQGEVDKSGWNKIKPSRKEQINYVMNLSFLEMASLDEVPRKLNLLQPPKLKEGEEPPKKDAPPRRRRLKSCSVRLNNNDLDHIDGSGPPVTEGVAPMSLGAALGFVCADLSALRWLDLSFNNISKIGDAFKATKGLNVVYLHANKIATLAHVKVLRDLPDLRSLTLHGNPIEDKKHYRPFAGAARGTSPFRGAVAF